MHSCESGEEQIQYRSNTGNSKGLCRKMSKLDSVVFYRNTDRRILGKRYRK